MKIYLVVKDLVKNTNYFAPELASALRMSGNDVYIGQDLLWRDEVFTMDIVYIQWPEYIFKQSVKKENCDQLDKRFKELHNQGVRIVSQCHNLKPHNPNNPNEINLYDVVYKNVDAIVHMGEYSKLLLQKEYPNVRHFVVPHHIYETYFSFNKSKKECLEKLNIDSDNTNILCFGKFRNKEERNLIIRVKRQLSNTNIKFIVPGFYRERILQKNILVSIKTLVMSVYYRLLGFKFSNSMINDDTMELYFKAADIVMIQRPNILNSGNLPMAFAAGKVVVGPNVGNVGCILKETGNPVFDPDSIDSVISAIKEGIRLNELGKGVDNLNYSKEHWSLKVVGLQLTNVLSSL